MLFRSTLLRMIAGFDIPSGGEILLNGKSITELPPNKRPINTVFQRYALFPHMNIFDNIAFGLKQKNTPKSKIVKKVNIADHHGIHSSHQGIQYLFKNNWYQQGSEHFVCKNMLLFFHLFPPESIFFF